MFELSFWWHPFTAEDPLLLFRWRNKLTYILEDLRVSEFEQIRIFELIYESAYFFIYVNSVFTLK